MTPEEVVAALGGGTISYPDVERLKACEWCGVTAKLLDRDDHWACERCIEGGGGEYPGELAARVSRKMLRSRFAVLPRDRDGVPILPSLTYRKWRDLWR